MGLIPNRTPCTTRHPLGPWNCRPQPLSLLLLSPTPSASPHFPRVSSSSITPASPLEQPQQQSQWRKHRSNDKQTCALPKRRRRRWASLNQTCQSSRSKGRRSRLLASRGLLYWHSYFAAVCCSRFFDSSFKEREDWIRCRRTRAYELRYVD